ncbi:sensor histidine kinase [Tissierella sp. MB52-C2]|uniref:sensor histidine kinase n=1 Tax=Tissierella sp. MB52-C2 TaxID=3070999 RepID=UPI00280B2035|nr:sensor histidine kinase [Tissierella sp. MB52-C2]WMM24114.1 sensor histidine kinase [Tissierella sp. MB52-C2]
MNFKDYLKDKLLYIIIYFISIFLVITIMMLDLIIRKERLNISNIIYGFVLSFIALGVIILINYMKKKKFYSPINYSIDKDEHLQYIFNIPDNINNEYKFLREALVRNYTIYIDKLEKYKRNAKTQMDFNNRWIHEMKTPVSVIKLMLENEKDKMIDETTRKSYESIEEEIEKLSHGLEMALHTLRVNEFELDFKVEEVSLLEVIRNVINENRSAFIVNSIFPKILSENDLIVISDKKWIKFVLSQILSNSIKYSKVKESENKDILIKIYKENNDIILSIKDRGVGIASGDLERVFDPFFTGKNGRKYLESTGMGLYLSKDICRRLGHGLDIKSREGEGTTVKVTFYNGKSIYNLENS